MRNISAPQRSHNTLSSLFEAHRGAAAARRSIGGGLFGSGIAEDYKLKSMDDRSAREHMVATQIAARGIDDERVLQALREVPRHLFVPPNLRRDAYDDCPLPIGEGQTISQPYIVASMTALLGVEPSHHVLDVGTGSGYQAAILARLARSVVTIERHRPLAERAAKTLTEIGATNVEVIIGDGSEGYPPRAAYDRILVAAGSPTVPDALKAQLAPGGRLAIPIGPSGFQRMTLVERRGDAFHVIEGEGCVFVPLVGRSAWPSGE
jgi:protein-L-isoaspartate(D-aspartate) O-methyltransferase